MKTIIIIFYLISISLSLRLDLIDDYYIKVYIGGTKKEYKLLVDLTYSFSYITKPLSSNTKKDLNINIDFSNIYGNYTGKKVKDIFNFEGQNIELEMKFIEVNQIYKNILSNDVDGVLGLGAYLYNKPEDENIFYNLKNADKFCLNNVTIYDKINKQIILCDNYQNNKKDEISFPLKYNDVILNNQGVINITKINVISNINEKEEEKEIYTNTLNEISFIGLIPTLIIPDKILNELGINGNENESSYEICVEDKEEFFYKKNNKKKNITFIDLKEFKQYFNKNYANNWYIGLGGDDIKRVYFDYDNKEIDIYLKSSTTYVIRIILYVLSVGFFLYVVYKVFTRKKDKTLKNDNEQELVNLDE